MYSKIWWAIPMKKPLMGHGSQLLSLLVGKITLKVPVTSSGMTLRRRMKEPDKRFWKSERSPCGST